MQPGPYGAPPPPAASTPTPPPSGPLSPSGWWYVVATALGIGGVVVAIVLGVGFAEDYTDRIDDFDRVEVPGSETFTLESGDYTIYQEYFGADDDFSIPPDVSVSITDPDGESVDLDDYTGEFTYAGSGHEGVALFTFEAEESGEYTVSTEGGTLSTIAVGEGIGLRLFVGIIVSLAIAFVGILAGAVIAIVVAVKRSGAKTRRQLAMVQSGWRPPPFAYPSGPGWPQQPPYGYQQPPPGYQPPPGGPHGPPPAAYQPPPPPPYVPPSGAAPSGAEESAPGAVPSAEQPGYQPSAPTRPMPPPPEPGDSPDRKADGDGKPPPP